MRHNILHVHWNTIFIKYFFLLYIIWISCDDAVKLLGVEIDILLNSNQQNKVICKKAALQVNVLKRIGLNNTFTSYASAVSELKKKFYISNLNSFLPKVSEFTRTWYFTQG